LNNAALSLPARRKRPLTKLIDLAVVQYRAVLLLLILYQAAMYMWVSRAYIHVTGVLFPWLLTQPGYRLYDTMNLSYPPVYIWFSLAFMQLIPDHSLRLRLGTVIIAALISLLIFVQARRWWNTQTALLAVVFFAAWGPFMLGYMMYFEFVLGLLSISAVVIWWADSKGWWRPLVAGLLIGLAVVIKQQALALIVILVIWRLAKRDWKAALRDIFIFGLGVFIPLGLVGVVLAAQGVLERALFLMTTYNRPRITLGFQPPDLQNILLLMIWLGLLPLFAFYTWRAPAKTRLDRLLLLVLIFVLFTPAFPNYGRFHLTGAMPFVSLMSAGVIHDLFSVRRTPLARTYGIVVMIFILFVGTSIPIIYRIAAGPQERQYEALMPVSEWVKKESGAPPGTRIWILPDIDPTGNFYPISGYLPPAFYSNTYRLWFVTWPDTTTRVLAGLESDPPPYIAVIDDWHYQLPEVLREYLANHYDPFAKSEIFEYIGPVTLYQRRS